MIKSKIINGKVFVEQTTYYVYKDADDHVLNRHIICTSDIGQFKRLKNDELQKEQFS